MKGIGGESAMMGKNALSPFREPGEMSPHKRADGQETQEWLTLLPRLEGGRRDGMHSSIEAEAGS
jgi:hypothetical protein